MKLTFIGINYKFSNCLVNISPNISQKNAVLTKNILTNKSNFMLGNIVDKFYLHLYQAFEIDFHWNLF